jgi:sporulation protein YlmC with PRC-barrel domain
VAPEIYKPKEEREMNKMTKIIIGLGSIFCLVLLGTGVFSRGYGDEYPTAPVGGVYMPTGWNTFEASWLIGHRVLTPLNTELGQISSLVIDRTNGRIALVVLSDVPNIGHERLVLPYSSIRNIGQDTCEFYSGDMVIGPSLEPNYVINSDPYIYALTLGGHPEFFDSTSAMDVAWVTDVYTNYGQVPYWEAAGEPAPSSLELFDSSRLMGAQVQLSSGEVTGEIHDFVVDASDGHIVFIVLSDVPGRSDTYVAVPFMALSTRENVFVLNATSDQLASAVAFDEYADLDNLRWASNVYAFFGVAPYWTESTMATPAPSEDMEP